MKDGGFEKIGESDSRMYGPRGLLVCGYALSDRKIVLGILKYLELTDIPVVFPTSLEAGLRMGEVLALPERSGFDLDSDLRRAIIMSGLTEAELKNVMATHREAGLTPPLWATLTPTSEGWTLDRLLGELAAEAAAFRQKNVEKGSEKA